MKEKVKQAPTPDVILGEEDISVEKRGAHIVLFLKGRAFWLLPKQTEILNLCLVNARKEGERITEKEIREFRLEQRNLYEV